MIGLSAVIISLLFFREMFFVFMQDRDKDRVDIVRLTEISERSNKIEKDFKDLQEQIGRINLRMLADRRNDE